MIKRYSITAFMVLVLSSTLQAQGDGGYGRWDSAVLRKANTAEDSEFMNEDEQRVVLLVNLARSNGPLFAETFLKQYLLLKDMESNRYVMSLLHDLKEVKDLPMLQPEKDLYNVARDHAIRSGKKGYKGHKGFNGRYAPVMKKYMEVGENIYYGQYTAEEIVLQLLIDEGIEDLGHRKNILNPRFNSIGVSIKPHKSYTYNCVISFGRLPRSYKEFIQ